MGSGRKLFLGLLILPPLFFVSGCSDDGETTYIDSTEPEILLDIDDTNLTVNRAWWTIKGLVSDDREIKSVTVDINNGASITTISDIDDLTGAFTASAKLKAGENTYSIIVTDMAGNTAKVEGIIYQGFKVAAGGSHSGILKDGNLYTWGRNNAGQTGLGYNSEPDEESLGTHPLSPMQVTLPTDRFVSLSFNQNYSLAIDDAANVWSWGYNRYGELGRGNVDEDCSLTLSSGACSLSMGQVDITDIIMVSAGYSHAMALRDDDTVWTWGSNSDGELGNGDTESDAINLPVQVNFSTSTNIGRIVQISAGSDFSAVLDDQGQAWIWGKNNYGQAGQGEDNTDDIMFPTLVPMPDNVTIKSLATGKGHVLALAENGDVYGWGLNSSSQIGYYGYQYKETEDAWERYIYQPVRILEHDEGNPVTEVYANGNSSYIVRADKKIYPWGQYGETLEDGSQSYTNLDYPENRYSQVSNIKGLAAGALHIVATQEDDTVFTFKWNFQGSLGGGETTVDRWFYNYPIMPQFPTEND